VKFAKSIIDDIGAQVMFVGMLWKHLRKHSVDLHSVFVQIDKIILQSLPTVAVSGLFVGAILVIQFTVQIQEFGALGFLGGLVTSSAVREVGPLLIAFLLSGKIGAYTTAELGTMKVTEQIDAIRCLGADPIREIIIPRFIGIEVASFILLGLGIFSAIIGGLGMAMVFTDTNPSEYFRHVTTIVSWPSILSGVLKCFVFGFLLSTICTFKGYHAEGGARGVGRAVVQTAVFTMIGIVLSDWATTLMSESAQKLWENVLQ
jgi:phospholipid/cholesterol/gamma-HCH transport system permease protein